MKYMDKKEKEILSKDEIGDILNAPVNFYISWGTFIVTFVMIILIVICSYLPCTQSAEGEAYFSLENEDFIECLIIIEKQDHSHLLNIGQEIIIEGKAKNEIFIGKIDSIALQSYRKGFQIKAKFSLKQNHNIKEYIINGNIGRKNIRIIIDKFYLGNKILNSFMNLFIRNSDELD